MLKQTLFIQIYDRKGESNHIEKLYLEYIIFCLCLTLYQNDKIVRNPFIQKTKIISFDLISTVRLSNAMQASRRNLFNIPKPFVILVFEFLSIFCMRRLQRYNIACLETIQTQSEFQVSCNISKVLLKILFQIQVDS